jgi:hypothetical protein
MGQVTWTLGGRNSERGSRVRRHSPLSKADAMAFRAICLDCAVSRTSEDDEDIVDLASHGQWSWAPVAISHGVSHRHCCLHEHW